MKFVLYSVLFLVSFVTPSIAGSAKVRALAMAYSNQYASVTFDVPISLPPYVVKAKPAQPVSEEVLRNLERMFAPRKEVPITVVGEPIEDRGVAHGLSDSIAEYAMIGSKQIRELKGGVDVKWFSNTTTTLYLWKSGISWHSRDNKYVTYTFGPKMRWSYTYHNNHDLVREVVKKPIVFLNQVIEKPFNRIFDR